LGSFFGPAVQEEMQYCSNIGILLKYRHIGQISRYFRKYRNIEAA
jgi:hypothetical protein